MESRYGNQPPLSAAGERILRDIWSIGVDREVGFGKRLRVGTPGPEQLYALCELLALNPPEERLQQFLENEPGFVAGLLGGPDNADLAVLFKPYVGTAYRADFCVLQAHQGGAVAHLVEIESSHDRLFTREGRTAKRLSSAMTQIEDWRIWIAQERRHYARELIRIARQVPLLPDYQPGDRGFRLADPDRIEGIWDGFGGFEDPSFTFTIIVGRWSQLTREEKARLLNRNRQQGQSLRIHTYEQLARSASFRLERDVWFDENDSWGTLEQPIDTSL